MKIVTGLKEAAFLAGNNDIKKISLKYGPIGIGAGSIFVYKGSRKAVLINYPNEKEKIELCSPT